MSRVLACVLVLSVIVAARTPAQDSPTFEVASIRPASPQTNDVRAGVRIAGAQVRFVSMSIKDLIGTAYGVKPQQIAGPDWLGQERFDLTATIPAGSSVVQLSQMLRSLLVSRFGMTVHSEQREFPVYVLGLTKDGPKFQASTAPVPAPETGEKRPLVDVTATGGANGVSIDLGGGSLGSRGRNRFVNNAGLDVAVTNANTATAPIRVDASGNYWGGGAPVMSSSTPADVSVSGNVMFNAPTHLTADPAR